MSLYLKINFLNEDPSFQSGIKEWINSDLHQFFPQIVLEEENSVTFVISDQISADDVSRLNFHTEKGNITFSFVSVASNTNNLSR